MCTCDHFTTYFPRAIYFASHYIGEFVCMCIRIFVMRISTLTQELISFSFHKFSSQKFAEFYFFFEFEIAWRICVSSFAGVGVMMTTVMMVVVCSVMVMLNRVNNILSCSPVCNYLHTHHAGFPQSGNHNNSNNNKKCIGGNISPNRNWIVYSSYHNMTANSSTHPHSCTHTHTHTPIHTFIFTYNCSNCSLGRMRSTYEFCCCKTFQGIHIWTTTTTTTTTIESFIHSHLQLILKDF